MSTRRSLFVTGVLLLAAMLLGSVAPAEAQVTAAPGDPTIGNVVPNGYGALLAVWNRDASQTTADAPSGFDVRYEAKKSDATSPSQFTGFGDTIVKVGNVTTTTISGLKHGTRYLVAVRARNAIGNSSWSPGVPEGTAAATLIVPMPDDGEDLTLTAMDMGIMAMWEAGDGNGVDPTGYEVQVKTTAATTWKNNAHFGTATSTTITGLMNGTEYSVRVRTLNGFMWASDQGWSDIMKATPMADDGTTDPGTTDPGTTDPGTTDPGTTDPGTTTGPGTTGGLPHKVEIRTSETTSTSNRIYYSWVTPGSGDSALVDYLLEYMEVGKAARFTNNIPPNGEPIQYDFIDGLRADTTYEIKLRAQNRTQGYGEWSESFRATTQPVSEGPQEDKGTPGAPQKVVIRVSETTSTTDSITFSWVTPGSGLSALIDYQLEYNEAGRSDTFTNNIPPVAGATQEYTIQGLKAGTKYEIRLRAQNRTQGYGRWSDRLYEETMSVPGREPTPAVSKMDEPRVYSGDKMLEVYWSEPASEKSITHYQVDYKTASAEEWMDEDDVIDVTATKYHIEDLINGTAYLVRVRAVDSAGNMGVWSDAGSGTPMMEAEEAPTPTPTPTPALPLFGAFGLGAGLLAVGRARMRRQAQLRGRREQRQLTR